MTRSKTAAWFDGSYGWQAGRSGECEQVPQAGHRSEAAQELMRRNGHDLLLSAAGIVPPEEGNTVIVQADEAMVADGDVDRN